MFDITILFRFDGSFPDDQDEYVPLYLKTLVSMLINGPNIQHQIVTETQTYQTVSRELIYFISKKLSTPNVSTNRD